MASLIVTDSKASIDESIQMEIIENQSYNTVIDDDNDKVDICCICIDIINKDKNFAKTNCQHLFCLSCLLEALKKKQNCPICRADIQVDKPNNTKELTLTEGVEIINEEMRVFPFSDRIDVIRLFDNPVVNLKAMMRVFSVGLVKSIIRFQKQDNEDWEESQWEISSGSDESDSSGSNESES